MLGILRVFDEETKADLEQIGCFLIIVGFQKEKIADIVGLSTSNDGCEIAQNCCSIVNAVPLRLAM